MAGPQIEIFCVVDGEYSLFPIKIESSDSVGTLKNKIKEAKNAFAKIDADHLKLYHVDIQELDDMAKAVEQELSQHPATLQPWERMAYVFKDGVKEETLIIVQPPNFALQKTPENHPSDLPNMETTPPSAPGSPIYQKDISEIRKSIDQCVSDLKPMIKEFLINPRLPNWVPPESVNDETREFYNGLAIPLVNGKPNLLLHKLGNNPNQNVNKLFYTENHQIFCNTSGSGKTRLLFEGLCQHWGFYFVAARGTDYIGSQDLEVMILRMSKSSGWILDIFEDPNPVKVKNANRNNEDIAFNRIAKAVLARWVVFDAFIKVAKDLNGGVLHDDIRHHWLLFQILPLLPRDPFLALIDRLVGATSPQLELLTGEITPKGVLGPAFNGSFFYVLDEAQVAGEQYMGAFADADGEVPRPVLRPIIQYLASPPMDPCIRIIASGTGFSLNLFKPVMTSGVGKDSSWDVVHTTGDFANQDTQLAYISRYVPPPFLLSQSGSILKARMYEWLRGRHRFTVRYLEELIRRPWKENCPASPHKLLNAYIHRLADFAPLNVDTTLLGQEADTGPVNIDGFQWEKIERVQDLTEVLSHSIFAYVTRGEYPMWDNRHAELVEYGLARFTGGNITIEEPLALVSIMRFLDARDITIEGNIQRRLQDNNGTTFEEVVLLATQGRCEMSGR